MSDDIRQIQQIVRQSLQGWRLAGITGLPVPDSPVAATTAALTQPQPSGSSPGRQVSPEKIFRETPSVAGGLALSSEEETFNMGRPRQSQGEIKSPVSQSQVPAFRTPPSLERSTATREQRLEVLQKLSCEVAQCRRCEELATTRTQTVFGVGNPQARLVFMGEAPGADEDKKGEPFVGRAGQLLNKIIVAMNMKREDLYICNILRCRPPGNRAPTLEEAQNCREWLDGQLRTVDPDFIVCWGTVAAQNLLGSTEAISKLRGRLFDYGRAKVLCTYHPSYLLRNPAAKKPVWEDMKLLLAEMGLPVPQ